MDFLQYSLFILTGAIAIFGIAIKAKKEDNHGFWNNLTSGGITVLILSSALLVCNILLQYFKNEQQKTEKELLAQKGEKDSIIAANKNFKDSTTFSNKSILDSTRHYETLDSLRKQREVDSIILNRDSIHYEQTLKQLANQLTKQQQTLTDINAIMHPIFPLKFEMYITIPLETFRDNNLFVNKLIDSANKIYKLKYSKDNRISDFGLANKKKNYSDFIDSTDVIEQTIKTLVPNRIYFNLGSNDKGRHFGFILSPNRFQYSYNYSWQRKIVTIVLETDLEKTQISHNSIRSFEDVVKDSLLIGVEYKNFTSDYSIQEITFTCGENFYNRYYIPMIGIVPKIGFLKNIRYFSQIMPAARPLD